MALSHWKNTKEQEKFTTIKGFYIQLECILVMQHCFQKYMSTMLPSRDPAPIHTLTEC